MSPVNHGQSNEKKEHPLLSDRFEVVVITEEQGQRQCCEKKDGLHFPAEIVLDNERSVKLESESPLVSSERARMDYISLKGIKNQMKELGSKVDALIAEINRIRERTEYPEGGASL